MYLLFLLDKKRRFLFWQKFLKREIGRLLYIRNLHPVTGSSSCSCLVHSLQSHRYDKDLNATGEPKKAHWHVIVVYGSPQRNEQRKKPYRAFKRP